MTIVFWDAQGILLIQFLLKYETINADRYIETLKKLKEKIRFKRAIALGKCKTAAWQCNPTFSRKNTSGKYWNIHHIVLI